MGREQAAHRRNGAEPMQHLDLVDEQHLVAVQHAEIDRLLGAPRKLLDMRTSPMTEVSAGDGAEPAQGWTQAVLAVGAVGERSRSFCRATSDAMRGAAGESDPLGQLREREPVGIRLERAKDRGGPRDHLDPIGARGWRQALSSAIDLWARIWTVVRCTSRYVG